MVPRSMPPDAPDPAFPLLAASPEPAPEPGVGVGVNPPGVVASEFEPVEGGVGDWLPDPGASDDAAAGDCCPWLDQPPTPDAGCPLVERCCPPTTEPISPEY
jgi:hypothetical protein